MGRSHDALSRGSVSLLAEAGEIARLSGECVDVLIDRNPKIGNQAKNLQDNEGGEFSRIQMDRCEVADVPSVGMTFTDRDGNKHRIRSFRIVDDCYQFDCIVSPPA